MKFVSFSSGSCGNCYYLGGEDGRGILIDAGMSMRCVKKAMSERGLSITDVFAILVTHDHSDHMRYLGTYCKYLMPKVYTTRRLHGALAANVFTRDHISPCRQILQQSQWNAVGDWQVRYFEVPHDATQTVGYALRAEGQLFVLMTDLDNVPQEAMELAKAADTVVIESNYDYEMLLHGPYPYELKKRILEEGHLSNSDCACAIMQFWHPGLKNLFLCHLSATNNNPQMAYDSASAALAQLGVEQGTVNLRVLARGVPSAVINL